MSEDLISNNFVDNIDRSVLRKTLSISKLVLNMVILYSIVTLIEWYILVTSSLNTVLKTNATYFSYRIHPIIAVVLLTIGIINASLYVKGNRLINLSFEKGDAELFNKGYSLHYTSGRISFVSFFISLITITIRILLR